MLSEVDGSLEQQPYGEEAQRLNEEALRDTVGDYPRVSLYASKYPALSDEEQQPAESTAASGFLREVHSSVVFVYLNAFLIIACSICTNPVYVLYFNDRGWTTPDNVFFFALVTLLQPVLVVLLNPVFGYWQGRRTSTEVFLFDIVFTTFGYFTMSLISLNRWIWLAGYVLSRIGVAQGSVRTTYIIRTTEFRHRTQALAILPMCALAGALVGPLIAMACSLAPSVTLNGILFDSSTLCFWAATGMSLLRLPFLIWKFDEQIFSDVKKSSEASNGPSDSAVWRWLALFIVTVILYNITYGVLMLCFQPILINQYKFGQFQISATMFTIVIVSLIPISFMAFLSKRGIQDRWFLIIGLGVACIPVAIFQWPSGSVWTVVLGGIFAVPFTTLIIPSCNTLFSKKAGTENASGFKVGLLLASVSIGLATGNALGAIALSMYGSYEFLMWLVPLFVDFVIILVVFRLLYVPPVTKAVSINDMEEDRWLLNDQHAKKP